MSYPVSDISKYIIFYSNQKNYGITPLRLQKILYFVQMYFLKIRGTICFNKDIEAWGFGPVIPSVWKKYLRFGCGQICDYRDPKVQFNNKIDKQIVEGVIDLLAEYSTSKLVDISMNQSPYLLAKDGYITIQSMQKFIAKQEESK